MFSYDAPRPSVVYHNNLDEGVLVSIEGTAFEPAQPVRTRSDVAYELDECAGTAIVVETQDGEPVGRVDEPACPGWALTINEDGTLEYAES
ncbi:hypothetical protein [Cellulomonas sp. KRMCY2]|uniref:hypothetical protein n=1 Tax=Cellulomonas sp. KRMCY2 TaxID=1304865 RepID=UPI00045E654E|nr:hypothetical protein [Cellulomonas sp. KRMCY2]